MRITHCFLALTLSAALACGSDETPAEETPSNDESAESETAETAEEPETPPSEPGPTGTLMREHFTKVREARAALIGDDIEAARAAMSWLAENNPGTDQVPEPLRPNLEAMRQRAHDFGDATTLTEASMAFAGMLNYCGECHASIAGGPQFAIPPTPDGDALPDQMHRHRWAIERMWEGVVSRNLEAYQDGANVMSEMDLRSGDLPQGVLEPERIDAIITHVRTLSNEAKEVTTWEERSERLGGLIATCATCHRAMGVGPFARQAIEAQGPSAME